MLLTVLYYRGRKWYLKQYCEMRNPTFKGTAGPGAREVHRQNWRNLKWILLQALFFKGFWWFSGCRKFKKLGDERSYGLWLLPPLSSRNSPSINPTPWFCFQFVPCCEATHQWDIQWHPNMRLFSKATFRCWQGQAFFVSMPFALTCI